jgi:hypothetical protein
MRIYGILNHLVTVEGNSILQHKYDHYQHCFKEGTLLTMAGFTSISLRHDVATDREFSDDKLIYKLSDVTGVDLRKLSMYPEEELLLIPPCVFMVQGSTMDNGRLEVSLRHVRQAGASYLSEDDHDNIGFDDDADGDGDGGNSGGDNGNDADGDGRGDNSGGDSSGNESTRGGNSDGSSAEGHDQNFPCGDREDVGQQNFDNHGDSIFDFIPSSVLEAVSSL